MGFDIKYEGYLFDSLPPQISSTMIFSTGEFVGCFKIGERLGDVLSLQAISQFGVLGWFRKDGTTPKVIRFPRSALVLRPLLFCLDLVKVSFFFKRP